MRSIRDALKADVAKRAVELRMFPDDSLAGELEAAEQERLASTVRGLSEEDRARVAAQAVALEVCGRVCVCSLHACVLCMCVLCVCVCVCSLHVCVLHVCVSCVRFVWFCACARARVCALALSG